MIEHGTTATVLGVDHFLLGTNGSSSKQPSRLVPSRETKRSIRVYLVLRFWCFKNFQMPPPKKYDNKILHVGPVEVF